MFSSFSSHNWPVSLPSEEILLKNVVSIKYQVMIENDVVTSTNGNRIEETLPKPTPFKSKTRVRESL